MRRRPLVVLALALVFAAFAAVVGAPAAQRMTNSPADFDAPGSESVEAREALARAAGAGGPGADVVALVRPGAPIGSPEGRAAVERAADEIAGDPGVGRVQTPFAGGQGGRGSPALVSEDGRSALVVAHLLPGADGDRVAERLLARFGGDGEVLLGGEAVAGTQFGSTSAEDVKRAELLAFPLLLALALLVFRGPVAALVPVLLGAVAVTGSLAGLRLVAEVVPLSAFALNAVVGLGLGLAVDYSLLIVSRYREELADGGDVRAAIGTTVRTAGRTVLHSALTVAASLAALLVFPQRFLYSVGLGGVLVSLLAAGAALIVLPALLEVLGPRIGAPATVSPLSLGRRRDSPRRGGRSEGAWSALARTVMRRPAASALLACGVLAVAALPVLGLRFTSVDGRALPEDLSARQVSDVAERDFPAVAGSPVYVAVEAPRDAEARRRVEALARRIGRLEGAGTVAPPVPVGDGLWRIDVAAKGGDPFGEEARGLVSAIRGLDPRYPLEVAGPTAHFENQLGDISSRLPAALAVALAANLAVLFAATGSLVLPIKQFLMNALTVAATFGVLVWVFQEGHLTGVLGFEGLGAIAHTTPPVVVILAFALSTDYGVFLLSRVRELRDRGLPDREAIAEALGRTGPTITAAALLFAAAVGAFATSEIVFVKEVGVGAAVAVLIDATVVRALLVPSLMAMLGSANWWAPSWPLRRPKRAAAWHKPPAPHPDAVEGAGPSESPVARELRLLRVAVEEQTRQVEALVRENRALRTELARRAPPAGPQG
jgi:RND superfamily putative drug exporter